MKLRRRRGVALFIAILETVPLHYRILRSDNGRVTSLRMAVRLALSVLKMRVR